MKLLSWMRLIILLLNLFTDSSFAYQPSNLHQSQYEQLENITDIIDSILVGYDIRLRPDFGLDPLKITMDIAIASFDSISEVNMDFTITLHLNQRWKDRRLAFRGENLNQEITLSGDFADRIWVPDTFCANEKSAYFHEVTEKNKMIRLKPNGEVLYGMRFTSTLACMMDLHYYPLDFQKCSIEIESYGYTVSDVVMAWFETPVLGMQDAKLPQFTILSHETSNRRVRLATGVYQRLRLSFNLKREIGYFIFQTYLPSILIVMLSWVSFWINHEATSARVTLGITTVLTMTTISTAVRSSLPRISYIKAIDIYLVMCFVFVFAALLEYAAVNYSYWDARAKKKKPTKLVSNIRKEEENVKNRRSTRQLEGVELRRLHRISPTSGLARLRRRTRAGTVCRQMPNQEHHWTAEDESSYDYDPEVEFGQTTGDFSIIDSQPYMYDFNKRRQEMLGQSPRQQHLNPTGSNQLNLNEELSALQLQQQINLLNRFASDNVHSSNDPMQMQPTIATRMAARNLLDVNLQQMNEINQLDVPNVGSSAFNMRLSRSLMSNLNQLETSENPNNLEFLLQKRLNLLQALKRVSKWTQIKDVNKIDRYSRLLFPVAFASVNILYWTFYIL